MVKLWHVCYVKKFCHFPKQCTNNTVHWVQVGIKHYTKDSSLWPCIIRHDATIPKTHPNLQFKAQTAHLSNCSNQIMSTCTSQANKLWLHSPHVALLQSSFAELWTNESVTTWGHKLSRESIKVLCFCVPCICYNVSPRSVETLSFSWVSVARRQQLYWHRY